MRNTKIKRCIVKLLNGAFLQGLLAGIIVTLFLLYFLGFIGMKKDISETGLFLPPLSTISHNSTNQTSKYGQFRILCLVSTCNAYLASKAIHVAATWGAHCDTLLFMSARMSYMDFGNSVDTLPVIRLNVWDSYSQLWEKTKLGMRQVWSEYKGDYEFVIKTDDDTFVVMDNLRRLLVDLDPKEALYLGHKQKMNGVEYMSGGAGYVLSKAAINKLITKGLDTNLCDHPIKEEGGFISEDLQMGACLNLLGVKMVSSMLDGRSRFLPFRLEGHLVPELSLHWWRNHTLECSEDRCASHEPISFHYVKPFEMYNYYYLLYNVHKYEL